MARRTSKKSLMQLAIEAQQRRAKEKAERELRAKKEADKAAAALARKQLSERQKAEREAAAAERRKEAEDKRAMAQALRELERRETRRLRDQERDARERVQAKAAAEREAKAARVERLKADAQRQTRELAEDVEFFEGLLVRRERGLEQLRSVTDAAFAAEGAEGLARSVTSLLVEREYLRGVDNPVQVSYAPDKRQLSLLIDLPKREAIPACTGYRYVASRGEIVADPRKDSDRDQLYQKLAARFVLCMLDYVFALTSAVLVDEVALNGHIHAKDRATGQSIHPCLVTVIGARDGFAELVLDEPELDPVQCLHHLNALVSPHPYDLEEVTPFVRYDLSSFKLVEEITAIGGLDARIDLLTLSPYEFEQLVRQLVEAMGFKAWRTQSSRDDGIDAVAYNDSPLIGGLCVIQAKRYKDTVPVEAVRAIAGTMHEKKATTGIVVATSAFGKASHDFASNVGRVQLIDGRNLKALLKQHLGIDVLIGLPKLPPGWKPTDLT